MPARPDGFVFPTAKCTHRCAWCSWSFTGTVADGVQRAKAHRETKHGIVTQAKKRGIGTCGVYTCGQPAVKRIQGRGLCPEHLDVVRSNAEKRGWTSMAVVRWAA